MGQIVFLYFLQKKGWLGVEKGKEWGTGPHDFLRRLSRHDYGAYENFFNDMLEPLFFDTLATDRGHEAWCKRFNCRIPFLNGGVIDKRRHGPISAGAGPVRFLVALPLLTDLLLCAKHLFVAASCVWSAMGLTGECCWNCSGMPTADRPSTHYSGLILAMRCGGQGAYFGNKIDDLVAARRQVERCVIKKNIEGEIPWRKIRRFH
jgi:hypothetical protein